MTNTEKQAVPAAKTDESLKTINGWSIALKRDRRTVQRRLRGYEPVCGARGAKLYHVNQITEAFSEQPTMGAPEEFKLRWSELCKAHLGLWIWSDTHGEQFPVMARHIANLFKRGIAPLDATLYNDDGDWLPVSEWPDMKAPTPSAS